LGQLNLIRQYIP